MGTIRILAAVMLISLMLAAGMLSNRERLVAVLQNYGLIGRALLANFIIVPIFGLLVTRLFHLNDQVATGLLLMAIAPGVPFVVAAGGRKKGGSLGFAIELALLMPALTVLTFPITAKLVLPAAALVREPTGHILTPLVLLQLLPLLIGILVAYRAPALAERLTRPLAAICVLSLLAVLVMLSPAIAKAIASVYGSLHILAILIVVCLSIITGWLLGGPAREYRRTLGIATALRNIGLCLVIATTDFPGTLVGPTVMVYLVIQALVCAIAGEYFRRTTRPVATASA